MKTLASLFFVLFLSIKTLSAQTPDRTETVIAVGESIQETLTSESIHAYKIALEPDHFVYGFVNQQSVDVVVTIYDPDGNKTKKFDGPAVGKESFQFETESGGVYRIEVTPFEEKEGDYTILVSVAEPLATDPAGRTDQLMVGYTGDDVPGAAVMIIKDGGILFQKSYGISNITHGIPMDENTVHNIGSSSKQFLTFGLLLLQDEGKLSLDDDVRDYIPELPEFEHTVTLRHLVNHTSGYREFINLVAMTGRNVSTDLDIEKIIEIIQRQPVLQNEPGNEFNYNNTGYALITEVIHRVTDNPFPEWMEENVFGPLEMHHTVVRTSPNEIVKNRSAGYAPGNKGGYQEVTDLGGAAGPGGIHSTMGNLAKWIKNLNNPTVGTVSMIEEMTTPFELKDGSNTEYGLGLFIQEYKGLPYFHHGGADMAHRSMLMVFPGINAAVITQSNNATFNAGITNQLADLFLKEHLKTEGLAEEPEEATADSEEEIPFEYETEKFDLLSGQYELDAMPGFILSFARDGDRIYTQATNQPEVNLTATSDSTFNLIGVDATITFHRNENTTADSLTLHQNGNHTARKIEFKLEPDQMPEYAGRYYSEEIETLYTVVLKDSTLNLRNYQMSKDLKLSAGSKDTFSSEFPLTSVHFVRNENGEISGFKASSGRTRDVLFEKWDSLVKSQ